MPPFGGSPRREDDGRDLRRRIWAKLGLLLLLSLLRWPEGGEMKSSNVFPNNLVVKSASSPLDLSAGKAFLAGHGGEEERLPGAVWFAFSSLLAGHGGEEELERGCLVLSLVEGSCSLCWCSTCSNPSLRSSLAHHGGGRRGGGSTSWAPAHQRLPAGCYGVSSPKFVCAEHASLLVGGTIFGRQGGPSATSKTEALLRSVRRSSSSLRRQVVRPRWRRSGRRISSIAGSMPSSASALYLDGNVSRSPAVGGGGAQGPDCFLIFCLGVLFANLEDLSSNAGLSVQEMPEVLLVILYPPRVMK